MRLLIVEDDDDIAKTIQDTLHLDGYEVDRASDGLDGLWMAREVQYQLIVLDLLMPGMNGFKVCETLRGEGDLTPILMLTAKSGDYDESEGLDVGADDYLRKPFASVVLRARVRALLRRGADGSGPLATTLERGEVQLDPLSRKCVFRREEVVLTGRQAQVLEALLRAGDNPASRAELVRNVWGLDFDGDPNVVDVYIGYLRGKLDKEAIENVHGLGYRVRA